MTLMLILSVHTKEVPKDDIIIIIPKAHSLYCKDNNICGTRCAHKYNYDSTKSACNMMIHYCL